MTDSYHVHIPVVNMRGANGKTKPNTYWISCKECKTILTRTFNTEADARSFYENNINNLNKNTLVL